MTDRHSPLDAALDVVLYVPVGLAITLSEELPKLAGKGRARLGGQLGVARLVGQMAVAQGRKEMGRIVGQVGGTSDPAPRPGTTAPRPASPPSAGGPRPSGPASRPTATPPAAARPTATPPAAARPPVTAPAAAPAPPRPPVGPASAPDDLGIPGYDSLSASQVVQRLAGLSPAELASVRDYEAASRGRRTILARIGQLQG